MKKILILSVMLLSLSIKIMAQTSESDYSLDGINNTLSKYNVVYASVFHDGVAKICVKQGEDDLVGLINKMGDIVLPFKYKRIGKYSENGLIAVADIHWKWGYADKKGNIVIPCIYNDYGSRGTGIFSEGLAAVYLDENTACYINEQGKIVISPFAAYRAGEFHGDLAPIEFNKKETSFINKKGEIVVPPSRGRCRNFTEGFFYVDGINEGDWLMNSQGKLITPKQVWGLHGIFAEGLMGFYKKDNKKFGFINKEGEIVIPAQFDYANIFCEGFAAVKLNNKWGFINKEGKIVIPCQFDRVENFRNFSEGLAAVCLNDKWGFINKEGKIVIPCQFEKVDSFSGGFAVVRNSKNQCALLDNQGRIVVDFGKLLYISDNSDGLFSISRNNQEGYMDKKGNAILIPKVK